MRVLCLHGHFYQPPREHPWLGVVEPEASAAPDRDWNRRITAECYEPNAAGRVLDPAGRLRTVVNNYEWMSFDFGPTLHAWLAPHAPQVAAALVRADRASRERTGYGNAWAQAYGHAILPLSTPRDVRTQVLWGRREFEHRFGRAPDGMWLPEMAVDLTSLAALADAGIGLTMLAPHQARRIRRLGAARWEPVPDPTALDTRRLYRCLLPGGGTVDVVFRDAALSHDVPFGALLEDGAALAARLRAAFDGAGPAAMVTVAADGETYGHHHRFGEMALAFALDALRGDPDIVLAGPAAFRAHHPPTHEVEIAEGTSWSCPHGIARWRAHCGCRVEGPPEWSQAWRTPLREAIDWLRDEVATLYEARAGEVLREPWGARDRYIDCVLEPARTATWLAREAARPLSAAATVDARRLLELGRHALLMQTSCGWFFDELARIEPIQNLRYAARAIELAGALGGRLEDDFVARLEPARSNLPARETGADVYRRAARGAAATAQRVAATAALLAVAGDTAWVPGYGVAFSCVPTADRLVADADVREDVTGAETRVAIAAEPGRCRADDERFTLADLFGVQRERLFQTLARAAGEDARAVVARLRATVDPLLGRDARLPFELAVLVGWDGAQHVAAALATGTVDLQALAADAAALRRSGAIVPARWLGERLARALEERLRRLPDAAAEAIGVLDVAAAAGVRFDLGPAQVLALTWRRSAPAAARIAPSVAALAERLALAPEDA